MHITPRRNILWLTMDHVTFHHYRCTQGARPVLTTYERLCRQGTAFTCCKSVHPLCTPARASMLTGLYSHNHGKTNNDSPGEPSAVLVCELLRDAGFDLGYFGKNHSGIESERFCFEGFYPRGYGNPYHSTAYRDYLKRRGLPAPLFFQEWGQANRYVSSCANGLSDLTADDNFNRYCSGYLSTPGPLHEVDFLADAALRWLDKRRANRPFVLRVDTWGPHHAYQVPLAYKNLLDPAAIAQYPSFAHPFRADTPPFALDFLQDLQCHNRLQTWADWQPILARAYEQYSYIDAALGMLIDAVRQRAGDTCILLTADHGDSLGSHGGMFDKCGNLQEELMDIPMVLYVPGAAGGVQISSLTSNLDIVPTILELAGLPVPPGLDGVSLLALAQQRVSPREDLMCEHYGHFAVHLQQRALYWRQYKYIATESSFHELYDLSRDPFELKNLFGEPFYAGLAAEMRRRLAAHMLRSGDSSPLLGQLLSFGPP